MYYDNTNAAGDWPLTTSEIAEIRLIHPRGSGLTVYELMFTLRFETEPDGKHLEAFQKG
jgi:hypothetical protein